MRKVPASVAFLGKFHVGQPNLFMGLKVEKVRYGGYDFISALLPQFNYLALSKLSEKESSAVTCVSEVKLHFQKDIAQFAHYPCVIEFLVEEDYRCQVN